MELIGEVSFQFDVENVSASSPDFLQLYFEKNWVLPEDVLMIPDEQAAVVTFCDPKGV